MDEKLPEGWVVTTLGEIRYDLAEGIMPNQFPEQFFELYSVPNFDLGVPEIVQGKNIGSNKQIIEVDTLLLCKINPRINRAWVAGNFSEHLKIASTEWIPFFKLEGVLPAYLCYYLRLHAFRDYLAANASGVGGSLMRTNSHTVDTYPFFLAPLKEQARIVAAIEQQFTRLDSAVASLRSAQAKVKQYRASLLKAAVEGELTKEWRAAHPASETGEQLLARILTERRARWEEEQRAKMREKGTVPKDEKWKAAYKEPQKPNVEDLPVLPEGWCWANVENLLLESPCNGISIKGSETPPGFPALKLSAMSDSGFDYDARRYILISDDIAEALTIQQGDFFVSRGNGSLHLVGRGTLAQTPPERIVFPDTMIRLRFMNIDWLRRYIACVWPSRFLREQIEIKARTTAGIYKISQPDVKSFVLPLPPLTEQAQIVAEIEVRLSNLSQLEQTIEHSLKRAEYERQSILREAFAGRLVEQDPTDEPASVLPERIREERAKREEAEKAARRANGGRGKQGNGQRQRPPAGEPSDALRRELQDARVVQMSWDMQD